MNDLFKKRMQHLHSSEQERMIKNKQYDLQDSINRSYFGFDVTKPELSDNIRYRVLIIRNDEDEQIISTFFENEIKIGTIVYWIRTDTYWLVHEQNLNEIAYFEGKMIECKNFQITINGEKFSTWGRIVLKSNSGDKFFDRTLLITDETALEIWIPNTEVSKEVFKLHSKFKILDQTWKVNHIDYITKNGILIIKAERSIEETIDYEIEENDIVNDNTYIDGPNFIAPLEKVTYYIQNGVEGSWSIPDNKYIQKVINNDNSITLVWTNARKRSDFTISYGDYSKEIHVKSLM